MKYSFKLEHHCDDLYSLHIYDSYEQNNKTIVCAYIDTLEKVFDEIKSYANRI